MTAFANGWESTEYASPLALFVGHAAAGTTCADSELLLCQAAAMKLYKSNAYGQFDMNLEIRPAGREEFAVAIDWALEEGWNPGLDDLDVFHAADPDGFLMGFVDDMPVSSISVVRYSDHFGFLGFYIVRPDRRGMGTGLATWNAGMTYLSGRTVGLDGVVAQQDNYRQSGFQLAGRNIRYTGVPRHGGDLPCNVVIRPADVSDLPALQLYDRQHFPSDRSRFLHNWVLPGPGVRRRSLVALADRAIAGYATIRECHSGFKVGPLFAASLIVAESLLHGAVATVPAGASVSLDVPEINRPAINMAVRWGLAPAFETARMYRGNTPRLPLEEVFGFTTFELG